MLQLVFDAFIEFCLIYYNKLNILTNDPNVENYSHLKF